MTTEETVTSNAQPEPEVREYREYLVGARVIRVSELVTQCPKCKQALATRDQDMIIGLATGGTDRMKCVCGALLRVHIVPRRGGG